MNVLKKRPRDSYDQTDLQTHTVRLTDRITKHDLYNYGSAIDLFDAIARTLLPYWEYNERYKMKIFKQLKIEPATITNMAHHVRAQLQILSNEDNNSNVIGQAIDRSNGEKSVYLESSPHGKTLQNLVNLLGIEIRLVTSYIYEEIISIIPKDLLEIQPLFIAFNDVSKQFFMLDKPANIKRDDLLEHQQTLDHIIQNYNLIPSVMGTSAMNSRCLSLFLSIAYIFKSNTSEYLDTTGLANQIRDAVYQQMKSNFDLYEKYIVDKTAFLDIRHDSETLVESNYYRFQLERPILFALAHVLQCNLLIFYSSKEQQQQPQVIQIDPEREEQIIVLLKNESTQRFLSARTKHSLNHLFPSKESESNTDPIYETIDQTPMSIDIKNKPTNNTFFSKTKDKFVTVVNKLVDNYGNLPKKQAYTSSNEQTVPVAASDKKPTSTKRPAPIAEHILRRQDETHSTTEVTYENTNPIHSTPVASRRSSTKNSQPSLSQTSNKRQLRPVPYKDRQKTLTRMGTPKTSVNQNIFNGVTLEDVDDSTTADEANNDDDDSFSDETADDLHRIILKERKKKSTVISTNMKTKVDVQNKRSTPYNYDQETLRRQQHNLTTTDEDIYENERQRDELNRDDDIYLSTSDIVQQDRKQLRLFINDRKSTKTPVVQQEKKIVTQKSIPTPTPPSTTATNTNNDRQSFLIDKDAVLEVLGHNIAQRDRHILMKVLKQEDLISKEWQRLVYLLDEYVNNPKKEKKERGLYALTLMENLDRLGYDMLEIQSTGPNHFKAIAKSILLIIEINDWFSEHICRVLHLNGPNDSRMIRHLRKLCLREWSKYPDNYRALFAQQNSIQQQQQQQQQRVQLDLTRELERFRSEDYYRSDMCALVNQALATTLSIPIHVVRAVREPNNPLEIYVPMRGTARPGLAIVLIASHPNVGDGRYDVAVLKGHPQTLRKHRNVTFDDKPEVRSFETNQDEQQQSMQKVQQSNTNPVVQQQQQQQQQQQPMINPALLAAHQAQFFANPFLYTPYTFATPQQQVSQQQPQQQQTPNSPSPVRANNTAATISNQSKSNLAVAAANPSVSGTTMMLQPQMQYIQMQQAQPTFVYNPLIHSAQQPASNAATTFFYTPANYPM